MTRAYTFQWNEELHGPQILDGINVHPILPNVFVIKAGKKLLRVTNGHLKEDQQRHFLLACAVITNRGVIKSLKSQTVDQTDQTDAIVLIHTNTEKHTHIGEIEIPKEKSIIPSIIGIDQNDNQHGTAWFRNPDQTVIVSFSNGTQYYLAWTEKHELVYLNIDEDPPQQEE